jgi:hypothetical protein
VADSTRRTYAAPLAAYRQFCLQRGACPLPCSVSIAKAGDWLAHVALSGRVSGNTVRTYRSALSTAWEEAGVQGDNPLRSALVDRITLGASKLLKDRDMAARAAREVTVELTPTLLAQFHPYVVEASGQAGAREPLAATGLAMVWAAACLGVFGLLRPNEFLYVGQKASKALLADAITFRAAPNHEAQQGLLPRGSVVTAASVPDRFEVALGATKADALGRNGRLIIAARMAVEALWRWMHVRRDAGHAPHAPLFVQENGMALASRKLLVQIATWYARLTGVEPKITGRAFRRGGASDMLRAGASIPDIMAAGRWRSPAMVGVYANAEARRAAAAAASRALNPLPRA